MHARVYFLPSVEKETYRTKHPQIAPDVRDGLTKQSQSSDVYSFGRIVSSIIDAKKLSIPGLSSLAGVCLEYNMEKRRKIIDLYKFLKSINKIDFLYECITIKGRERVLSISFVCKYICEYACFGKMQYSTPRFCPQLVLGYKEEGSCF